MARRVSHAMRFGALLLCGCAQLGLVPALPGAGGGGALTGRPSLTVLIAEDIPDAAHVRDALRVGLGEGFDLRFADVPAASGELASADIDLRLVAARKDYVEANFAPCLNRLSQAQLVPDLLAHGRRQEAARVLLWRAACRVGAGRLADARADAAALAVLGLDVPPDAAAVSPEVEQLFTEAERAAAATARAPLKVVVPNIAHARVAVDGREDACAAPCTLDVRPGDHVVRVDADGFAPDLRTVRVPGPEAAFTLMPAPPELAARQWTARYSRGPAVDSAPSVGLLSTATRSRTLAVLTVEAGKVKRLRGVLALDGEIAARAERPIDGAAAGEAPALVRDLLVRGRLLEPAPPIWQRPLFWVIVGGATAAAVGVTALILYEPPTMTTVHF